MTTNIEQKFFEYPYCPSCESYEYCKRNGLTIYKPKFLEFEKKCSKTDCPYDFKCNFDCPDYYELCLNDLEVARKESDLLCYDEPLPTLCDAIDKFLLKFENFMDERIIAGKRFCNQVKSLFTEEEQR